MNCNNGCAWKEIGRNKTQKIFLWLMPKIAILHFSNWRDDRFRYPQTWWLMPKRWKKSKIEFHKNGHPILKRRQPRIILEHICKFLTGHELSKTEWGYGGGKFLHRNCRWCDKFFEVPKDEEPTKRDYLSRILNE